MVACLDCARCYLSAEGRSKELDSSLAGGPAELCELCDCHLFLSPSSLSLSVLLGAMGKKGPLLSSLCCASFYSAQTSLLGLLSSLSSGLIYSQNPFISCVAANNSLPALGGTF